MRDPESATTEPALSQPGAAGAERCELAWLVETLWGANGIEIIAGEPRNGPSIVDRFGVLPNAERPRLLVPLGARRAGAQALRRYPSSKPVVRIATELLAVGFRIGLGERLIRDRICLVARPEARLAGSSEVVLQEHLREVLGRPDVRIAITFNAGRPQKKPVLQVIGEAGDVVAYVKVGWNDLTRALVAHETSVLNELTSMRGRPREFWLPQVLDAGRWRALELLVVAARGRDRWGRNSRVPRKLPIAATRELATLGEVSRQRLGVSGFWQTLRDALESTLRGGCDIALPATALQAAARLEHRHGDTELAFGRCHGDWVPWNMGRVGGGLEVWDWERSDRAAPLGLDAITFLFQSQLNLRKQPPARSVARVLARAGPVLRQLSLPERLAPTLLCLHLLQMTLRLEQGRAGGIGGVIASDRYCAALQALQARSVATA